MDYSDETRRTMSDALRAGKLTEEALEFLTGKKSQPEEAQAAGSTEEAAATSPDATTMDDSQDERSDQIDILRKHYPDDPVVLPGIVSMTFRLPAKLAALLARVSAERKLKRERPFSQQDIVAEALKWWLHRHRYYDTYGDGLR